jgi:group I intron endonuclease
MANLDLKRPCIYCIKNIISGRVYVGSAARGAAHRWKSHRSQLRNNIHTTKLQRSWNKHGEAAFEWSILEDVDDLTHLLKREQFWIDELHAACPRRGLNSSPTAGNCMGTKHSDETKEKWSTQRRGVSKAPTHRKAIGDAQKGKIISAAHRTLASEATRRYFEEHPEARERMREVGRKNGLAGKGRKYNQEVRANFSEARKKAWADPEKRLRMTAGQVGRRASQETRAKMSAIRKGRPLRANRSCTFEQAQEVRKLKADGMTYDSLVEKFGLDRSSLFQIVKGKTYVTP